MKVDILTGPQVPWYTQELANRLAAFSDLRLVPLRPHPDVAWAQLYGMLSQGLRSGKSIRDGAIVHVDSQRLAYVLTGLAGVPSCVTCHDILTFVDIYADESYEARSLALRRLRRFLTRRGLMRATAIVFPSQFTKREFSRLLPGIRPLSSVIPWGVDPERFRPRNPDECRRRLSLPRDRPIVLAVGTESPRKNLERLLLAFAALTDDSRPVLVKVGRARSPFRERLLQVARESGIVRRMIFVESASVEELPLYYAASDVFVQPSLYEGFGLPALEAMASGVPVVAARAASLPEVLGDAARYVDPEDMDGIAAGIRELLESPSTADEFRARGRSRALQFPWSHCVDAYLRLFEEVRTRATQ